MTTSPHGLRVEHLDEALGIRVRRPRLSWRLPRAAAGQTAYRLTADNGWDTGVVAGDQSLLVAYTGPCSGPPDTFVRLIWYWLSLVPRLKPLKNAPSAQ